MQTLFRLALAFTDSPSLSLCSKSPFSGSYKGMRTLDRDLNQTLDKALDQASPITLALTIYDDGEACNSIEDLIVVATWI